MPQVPDLALKEAATELLLEEADRLDDRRWRDWLELYEEDAVYWAPAWDDDHELVTDPHTSLSLIYAGNRERLEDRVWRIESGLSSSLLRLPRTRHLITNIRLREVTPAELIVTANFQVNTFKHEERRTDMFFGHYRYALGRTPDGLRIHEKYIVVCNDVIPRQMDVFNV